MVITELNEDNSPTNIDGLTYGIGFGNQILSTSSKSRYNGPASVPIAADLVTCLPNFPTVSGSFKPTIAVFVSLTICASHCSVEPAPTSRKSGALVEGINSME